jgi:two-component system phosphate regulon sensor histidine kinase PhoR
VSEPEPVLNIEEIDIKQLIKDAIDSFRTTIENKEGKIEFASEGKPIIAGDSVHLSNMLYNLLDNALKYSIGPPKVYIGLKEIQGNVQISVRDNGIGISREHLSRIFDRFYRVTAGDVHDQKGFGLGLNYVKLVVESHDGSISVKSEPGKGTTFVIHLPNGE